MSNEHHRPGLERILLIPGATGLIVAFFGMINGLSSEAPNQTVPLFIGLFALSGLCTSLGARKL